MKKISTIIVLSTIFPLLTVFADNVPPCAGSEGNIAEGLTPAYQSPSSPLPVMTAQMRWQMPRIPTPTPTPTPGPGPTVITKPTLTPTPTPTLTPTPGPGLTPTPSPSPAPTPGSSHVTYPSAGEPPKPPPEPPPYAIGTLVDCTENRDRMGTDSCKALYNYYFYSFYEPLWNFSVKIQKIWQSSTGVTKGTAERINNELIPKARMFLQKSQFREALAVFKEIGKLIDTRPTVWGLFPTVWGEDSKRYIQNMIQHCEYKIEMDNNNYNKALDMISKLIGNKKNVVADVYEAALADRLYIYRLQGKNENYGKSFRESLKSTDDSDSKAFLLMNHALHTCSRTKEYNNEVRSNFRMALDNAKTPATRATIHIALASVLNKYGRDSQAAREELAKTESICQQWECNENLQKQIAYYKAIFKG